MSEHCDKAGGPDDGAGAAWLRHTRTGGAAFLVLLALAGCEESQSPPAQIIAHGDATAGSALIRQYGCASCHAIPGIRGADGIVGPSLRAFAVRAYIGGVHPNTPETLVDWIMNAPGMSPDTAMPDMSIPEDHARDIAVYLHTLR